MPPTVCTQVADVTSKLLPKRPRGVRIDHSVRSARRAASSKRASPVEMTVMDWSHGGVHGVPCSFAQVPNDNAIPHTTLYDAQRDVMRDPPVRRLKTPNSSSSVPHAAVLDSVTSPCRTPDLRLTLYQERRWYGRSGQWYHTMRMEGRWAMRQRLGAGVDQSQTRRRGAHPDTGGPGHPTVLLALPVGAPTIARDGNEDACRYGNALSK